MSRSDEPASATADEVARAAGVSQATVSRAFAGGRVAKATRARVLAVAERMNYRPNAVARSLTVGRSHMVAVLMSDLTSLVYPELVYALTARLAERGYRALLFTTEAGRPDGRVLDAIWSHRADGVIAMPALSSEQCAAFAARGLPLLLYNQVAGPNVSSVYCDHAQAGGVLADALLAAGHRSFAVLAGPPSSFISAQLIAGLSARMADGARLRVARGPYRHEFGAAGYDALAAEERPDVVVCVNDTVAAGVLDHVRLRLGLSVPGDVSVVALNGRGPSLWPAYDITAMRQPTEPMADATVEMLLQRLADRTRAAEHRVFFAEFRPGATARLAAEASTPVGA